MEAIDKTTLNKKTKKQYKMKQNNNTKKQTTKNTFSHWVSAQQQPRSPRDRGHDHEKTNHKAT